MAKLTLTDITNGYNSSTRINANNTLIEAALENTLSRDGTAPNQMGTTLDMNGNRVINAGNASLGSDLVTLQQLSGITAPSVAIPSQAGNGSKVLGTDGSVLGWYDADLILYDPTGAPSLSSTRIGTALDELDNEKAGLALSNTFSGENLFTFGNSFQAALNSGSAAGGGAAYTVTLSPAITAYNTNAWFIVDFPVINTSVTPTIAFNGLAATTMSSPQGTNLRLGDINGSHILRYDGSTFRVLNPAKNRFEGAMVNNSGGPTLVTATPTVLSWTTELYDTLGIFNPASPTRLTVPTGWTKVNVSARVQISGLGGAVGYREISIRNGGTTPVATTRVWPSNTADAYIETHATNLLVTPGDYLEVYLTQTSGGSISAIVGYIDDFSMELVE